MSRVKEFTLPDLGEGLTEGEILQWFVAVGDTIKVNDPLVEVETAKAAVEVPSPYAGVVTEILAEPGATVDVGSVIDLEEHPLEPGSARTAPGARRQVRGFMLGRRLLEAHLDEAIVGHVCGWPHSSRSSRRRSLRTARNR